MSTSGKVEQSWPTFRAIKSDPVLGRKEMSPEQTLVEFISTSASFHGVKSQNLRSLEWDLLKVFPNNVMPANAAAWYMAKRKFYASQPLDLQLLAFLLKKYPDKFRLTKYKVEFLESYSKEAARRKLAYLVQFGLNAYFSHKVEEHGVYFFDPLYYEGTEPFHESLRICVRDSKSRLVPAYFAQHQAQFDFKIHSMNLVTLAKQPGAKVLINTTGVIVSMVNNQYGNIKFGAGEKAIFCAKSLFRDGWHYNGDPLRLPAMQFDAYKLTSEEGSSEEGNVDDPWIAVLVWCGRKPASKYYSMVADFSYNPLFQSAKKKQQLADTAVEGRKLRQPSSSMMVGQVVSIKKNGAVVSVREDSEDKVFVPGWCRELANKPGIWLTTLTGDCIGMKDLVAYYIDTEESMPGYTAVGKNVMVLREYEEADPTKKRRSRRSVSMSAGAEYEHSEDEFEVKVETSGDTSDTSYSALSESELEVSDSELEWLQQDVSQMMAADGPGGKTEYLFKGLMSALTEARAATSKQAKKKGRKSSGRDSGLESRETTPKASRPPYTPKKEGNTFWRTKAALAAVDKYRSSDDEDYRSGDEISDESSRPSRRRRRSKVESSQTSAISSSTTASTVTKDRKKDAKSSGIDEPSSATGRIRLPYWVRAISLPEEYEPETGHFLPVDRWYKEERDPDYKLPLSDDEYEECAEEEEDKAATASETAAESSDKPVETAEKEGAGDEGRSSSSSSSAPGKEGGIKKRRGSRLLHPLVTEIAADEVDLLVKEASEPLPEDLLQGAHRVRSTVKTEPTEIKQDSDKKEEEGEKVAEEDATSKQPEIVVVEETEEVSEFVRWARKALNPMDENVAAAEDDDDNDYVPPSVIFDSDLDYDEYDPEQEVLEEGELDGLLADQKQDLQRLLAAMPGTSYLPIWVPVESVKERKEAAVAAHKERTEAEATKEAAEVGEPVKLRSAIDLAPGTGLTPAMKKMALTSSGEQEEEEVTGKPAQGEGKVTRAKIGSSSSAAKRGEPKRSPAKKSKAAKTKEATAAQPEVKEAAGAGAEASDTPVAEKGAVEDVKKGTESAAKKTEAPAKQRKSSSEAKSPKKSPRRKSDGSGGKKSAAVEGKGDGSAAATDPPQPAAGEKENEDEQQKGGSDGAEKSQQCIQN